MVWIGLRYTKDNLNLSMNHTHKKVGDFRLLKNKILFCQEVAKDE